MSRDITENIGKYIFGHKSEPEKDDIVKMTDELMDIFTKMEKFINHITDERKRELMKKNISMAQQRLVENLDVYNEWLNKQSRMVK